MTEQDWLTSEDPTAMLAHIQGVARPRKLRLFAVACCRAVWTHLTDPHSRRAVEVAERFADGHISAHELAAACHAANGWQHQGGSSQRLLCQCARDCAGEHLARHVYLRSPAGIAAIIAGIFSEQKPVQAALLRDIVGNPWRPVLVTDNEWIADHERLRPAANPDYPRRPVVLQKWLTPTVLALAQHAYDQRPGDDGHLDPVTLLALSDALEEAGIGMLPCPDCHGTKRINTGPGDYGDEWGDCRGCFQTGRIPHPIVTHLRCNFVHVRGCAVVDDLLGKE